MDTTTTDSTIDSTTVDTTTTDDTTDTTNADETTTDSTGAGDTIRDKAEQKAKAAEQKAIEEF